MMDLAMVLMFGWILDFQEASLQRWYRALHALDEMLKHVLVGQNNPSDEDAKVSVLLYVICKLVS
jgi:hypothetical protein